MVKLDDHLKNKGGKAIILGVIGNFCLAITKGAFGVLGNSSALVADAVESMFDVVGSLVVYSGYKIALKPQDEDHPYGHGKAEPLAVMFVALLLLAAAFLLTIHSVEQILHPVSTPAVYTLYVFIAIILVKELIFRYLSKFGRALDSNLLAAEAKHHRVDALTSLAGLIGVGIAIIGGPKFAAADDLAALFAAMIIAYNAYQLFMPALAEVMDAAPSPHVEAEVRMVAAKVEGVLGLEKCFVRKVGLDYFVDLHVIVDGNLTVTTGHKIGHDVKDAIMSHNKNIRDVLVHIEPGE